MSSKNKCAELFIGSDNVLMDVLNTDLLDIAQRTTLTEAIEIVDQALEDILSEAKFLGRHVNVGSGREVFKGYNNLKGNEIRTLLGDGTVTVEVEGDEIKIGLDVSKLPEDVTYNSRNLGTGNKIFKSTVREGDIFWFEFRTITSTTLKITEGVDTITVDLTPEQLDLLSQVESFTTTNYSALIADLP